MSALGCRQGADPGMTEYSTELPFPNRGNSASAELLKEDYRPSGDLHGRMPLPIIRTRP
jgi:hypothetical protein